MPDQSMTSLTVPIVLVTPPTPRPEAISTNTRITSPVILVPYHTHITTTLTPAQLGTLLPTLHMYILPAHPSIAILPANSISHFGLSDALRWYECDVFQPGASYNFTLNGLVESYAALAFLGQKIGGYILNAFEQQFSDEIAKGCSLEEIQDIWSLRHLPFTEKFVGMIVNTLAVHSIEFSKMINTRKFQQRAETDLELQRQLELEVRIWEWVDGERQLKARVEKAVGMMEKEKRKVTRNSKLRRIRSAVRLFRTDLDTVAEE
ncbi:hypothetical protein BDV96DRAFT_35953 [Lophiotrema nucula]|uniref:Uncharacterized protein n=1 Tax=Lophiotrema nucula TaxID=690887 RepID=A0A6A5ZBC8_9PLEO|nr:hypothetical protein BDV96DRAFT_35953 [Lophiotrema nucula]